MKKHTEALVDMYEPEKKDVYVPEELKIVDEEPVGPAPTEYRWALAFAVLFVLGVLAWSFLQR